MMEPKGQWIKKPRRKCAIVFVHGILSSDGNAWRSETAYWPEIICSQRELADVGVYVFSYRADLFSGGYKLADAVDALNAYLSLDGLLLLTELIFVCHSMGGIVVRQFLFTRQSILIENTVRIGLFLIASPSLGSEYANLFTTIAKVFGNSQVQAMRFADDNTWLNDLDRNFINLKESRKLSIEGKELVEDEFIVLPKLFHSQVVKPFAGAKYFGESIRIPRSNHFTVATPRDPSALQHRLLVQFVIQFCKSSRTDTDMEVGEVVPETVEAPNLPSDIRPGPKIGRSLSKALLLSVIAFLFIGAGALSYYIISRTKPLYFSGVMPVKVGGNNEEPGGMIAADLNNDGKLDLVAINNNVDYISVLLGKGNGEFQPAGTYKVGGVPYAGTFADFNKDGILDLVITNKGAGTMSVLLGKGNGTFEKARNYQVGPYPTVPVIGDFNGDGFPDLAVGSWTEDSISVFLGRGNGSFRDAVKYRTGIQTACVGVGDFNSDGKLDLVVANNSTNKVTVLLGAGDGSFGDPRSFPTEEKISQSQPWWGPYSIVVADFNHDGHQDIAVTNFSDHNVGILLGRGDGTFEQPRTFETDEGPFGLAVGDFNNDDVQDLVSANNAGTVSVLLGNGDGTFQPKRSYETGGSSTSVVVADFNGDRKPDLAIANRNKNFIGLLLNSINITTTRLDLLGGNPSTYGSEVSFRAVVTSTQGTPKGTVRFHTEDKVLGTAPLRHGEALFSTSGLERGFHNISAEYKGSKQYNASSTTFVLNVQ